MPVHLSKNAAEYSPKGSKEEHCSICTHFHPPHTCTIVDGKVSPEGWCKYWKAKPKS